MLLNKQKLAEKKLRTKLLSADRDNYYGYVPVKK